MSRRRQISSRRGRAWDEQAIREALIDFLVGREQWPTYDEFDRDGAKGLRDAVGRIHGVEWWAREMGLPGGARRRGGVRRWNDETITAALATFIADRRIWPSCREFDAAGLRYLRNVLPEHGGVERWAARMGVELPDERRPSPGTARALPNRRRRKPPPNPRKWPLWNEQRIESELQGFLAGREEWPLHREFVAAGHKQLYHAVLRRGGTHLWAARMGVQWLKRQTPPPWSEERVRRELSAFLNDRGDWPTGDEFQRAGKENLLRAARRFGGRARWEGEFGLAARDPRSPRGPGAGGAAT